VKPPLWRGGLLCWGGELFARASGRPLSLGPNHCRSSLARHLPLTAQNREHSHSHAVIPGALVSLSPGFVFSRGLWFAAFSLGASVDVGAGRLGVGAGLPGKNGSQAGRVFMLLVRGAVIRFMYRASWPVQYVFSFSCCHWWGLSRRSWFVRLHPRSRPGANPRWSRSVWLLILLPAWARGWCDCARPRRMGLWLIMAFDECLVWAADIGAYFAGQDLGVGAKADCPMSAQARTMRGFWVAWYLLRLLDSALVCCILGCVGEIAVAFWVCWVRRL